MPNRHAGWRWRAAHGARKQLRTCPRTSRREASRLTHGRAPMALPDGASRRVGSFRGAEPRHDHGGRAPERRGGAGGKNGFAYVFDRVPGEPVWPNQGASRRGRRRSADRECRLEDANDLTPDIHALAVEEMQRFRGCRERPPVDYGKQPPRATDFISNSRIE